MAGFLTGFVGESVRSVVLIGSSAERDAQMARATASVSKETYSEKSSTVSSSSEYSDEDDEAERRSRRRIAALRKKKAGKEVGTRGDSKEIRRKARSQEVVEYFPEEEMTYTNDQDINELNVGITSNGTFGVSFRSGQNRTVLKKTKRFVPVTGK